MVCTAAAHHTHHLLIATLMVLAGDDVISKIIYHLQRFIIARVRTEDEAGRSACGKDLARLLMDVCIVCGGERAEDFHPRVSCHVCAAYECVKVKVDKTT